VPPPKKESVDWDAIIDADDDVPSRDPAADAGPAHAAEAAEPDAPDAPDEPTPPDELSDRPT
jgi:hypothetical protein